MTVDPGDWAQRLEFGYRSGLLADLHAVLAIRGGQPLFERYFDGEDENWGRPLGLVTFGSETLHDLRSVTKSVVSLLYGVALGQGLVPKPDSPLLDSFPEFADLKADPQRAAWTIDDALNMRLGTEWNEDLPYDDPMNSEIAMERAENRYRFILERPIVDEPGSSWTYNGGASALIGRIIEIGTGERIDTFANSRLFEPLGIDAFQWNGGSDGALSAASGLRMTAPGLARIGQMILGGGEWNGRQVVPADWIDRCRKTRLTTSFGLGYASQWYQSMQPIGGAKREIAVLSAMGNGGQRLYVVDELGLVMVCFCGSYNRPDQWMTPTLLLQRIVLSEFE